MCHELTNSGAIRWKSEAVSTLSRGYRRSYTTPFLSLLTALCETSSDPTLHENPSQSVRYSRYHNPSLFIKSEKITAAKQHKDNILKYWTWAFSFNADPVYANTGTGAWSSVGLKPSRCFQWLTRSSPTGLLLKYWTRLNMVWHHRAEIDFWVAACHSWTCRHQRALMRRAQLCYRVR